MLQWGRTLSSAERRHPSAARCVGEKASMGPHSFKCGKEMTSTSTVPMCPRLQWGRTLSSAESSRAAHRQTASDEASMGPHSFKCGKQIVSGALTLAPADASMGPHSFKCGKLNFLSVFVGSLSSFNGAALFQVRKERWRRRMSAKV